MTELASQSCTELGCDYPQCPTADGCWNRGRRADVAAKAYQGSRRARFAVALEHWGYTAKDYVPHVRIGSVVRLDPAAEEQAQPIRDTIHALHRQLDDAEAQLRAVYEYQAGPAPEATE